MVSIIENVMKIFVRWFLSIMYMVFVSWKENQAGEDKSWLAHVT